MLSVEIDGYLPLEQAILLATEAHAGQTDKGGQPYILHPLRVMMSMAPNDIVGRVVAVLHDTIEDTDIKLGDISDKFGDEVFLTVEALSRREELARRDFVTPGDHELYNRK